MEWLNNIHNDLPDMLIIISISAALFLFTRWRAIVEGRKSEE